MDIKYTLRSMIALSAITRTIGWGDSDLKSDLAAEAQSRIANACNCADFSFVLLPFSDVVRYAEIRWGDIELSQGSYSIGRGGQSLVSACLTFLLDESRRKAAGQKKSAKVSKASFSRKKSGRILPGRKRFVRLSARITWEQDVHTLYQASRALARCGF